MVSDEQREEAEFQTDLMIERYRSEREKEREEEANVPFIWKRLQASLVVVHKDIQILGIAVCVLLVLILWRVW